MTEADLIDELRELLAEHDRFIETTPLSNATSNAYYVDLVGRIAETIDPLLASQFAQASEHAWELVWKACGVIGLVLFVADITSLQRSGCRLPASRSFRRWFPPERVEELARQAAAVSPAVG